MATITSLACGPQATNQGNTGQTLLINGTALTGATAAKIGTRTVSVTVNGGGTQATCTVPSGCGVQNVTITATSGTSNARPFYYISPPNLSGIDPVEGSAATPAPIAISGDSLLTTNQVSINGDPTTAPPTVSSDNLVTATADVGAITPVGANPWFQSVDVSVRTAGGTATLADAFLAYDTPVVTTLTPDTGPAGTEVVIDGQAFVSDSIQVTFDGVQADLTALSDVQLLATAPTGPTGAVDVVVTTPGGSSAAVTFTYV
ncbi:hypothetical protein GCM10010191_46620 [Actinomadura vinacea]|uniref:IPT/TIG domain-containing protein n=1 Tax=Actinomadura vinacea TaxID=115336 RepID=A0ABP5WMT3_9ACTN